jgi:molybdopterin-synthase adenylyltransferase
MTTSQFERQERFFGRDGQERLQQLTVAVIGCGGLGSHLVQQLAYLGVRKYVLIDADRVAITNLNRLVGAEPNSVNVLKADVLETHIKAIAPNSRVEKVPASFVSDAGYRAIQASDYVFGCVDRDGARSILSQVCAAYQKPYFDLATEIDPETTPMEYGGRVFFASEGQVCLTCAGELDPDEVSRDLMNPDQRAIYDKTYGLNPDALGDSGPSVVSLNGAIASLAVTEFMLEVTGIRRANRLLTYRAHLGGVTTGFVEGRSDCTVCSLWGSGSRAGIEKHLFQGIGNYL